MNLTPGEYLLRRLLWLRHGCSVGGALYGDDGGYSAITAGIDFLRWTPDEIDARFVKIGTEAYAAIVQAKGR